MFSKLSKFRSSKSGSRNDSRRNSPQATAPPVNPKSPAVSNFRISFSQPAPGTQTSAPPLVQLMRNPSSLSVSQNTIPIPSVAPLVEDYDSESDGNVSFAECLFPITPPGEVRRGRRMSHESLMGEDLDDFDQLVLPPSARSLEPHLALPIRKQTSIVSYHLSQVAIREANKNLEFAVEMGRMSVDLGRRSVDIPAPARRSVDVKKMNWWDVDSGFSETALGRWENRKEFIENRRATWEASYRQVWVPPNGTGTGPGIALGNGNGGGKNGLTTRTTTRSWTSSSLPDAIDAMDATDVVDTVDAAAKDVLPPRDEAEDEFLEEFEEYFNNLQVDNLRRKQFPKLDMEKIVYLDYASFSLFSNFQVEEHLKILLAQGPCLGSASFCSSTDNPLFKHVADTQSRLLRMLNTTSSHYSIIFTAGFQDSFRLVAEAYPFQKGCPLLVCQDNHAAVRLVIQAAVRAGAKPFVSSVTEKELCFHSHDLHKLLRVKSNRNASNGGLFVYPAQSQLSGMKHSMGWVVEAQQHGWKVCLDASTLLPSNALDLDIHQPDFIVGSFHHMVGYPSGMGFLLVRRESFCVKASPSNETVRFICNKPADEGEHCHIMCPADNTMNLLQFAALNLGLVQLERIGFSAIQKRVKALSLWLVQRLRTLRHKDGEQHQPHLLRVYGSHAPKDRGSIVSFNVMDPSGTVLPPHIVRKLAARSNIQLSVGMFQNPGLAHLLGGNPKLRSSDVSIFNADSQEFTAVRASFGAVSNFADVYRLVQFLSRFRDEEYLASEAIGFVEERNQMQ